MDTWHSIVRHSITTIDDLKKHLDGDFNALNDVIARYPMRINSYLLDLIKKHGPAIGRQFIPHPDEIHDTACTADPLGEEQLSPAPNLVHKYPDRVLLLVAGQCAAYCRFCTRKRIVGTPKMKITSEGLTTALDYIRSHTEIKEVLISGGDPLLLSDDHLAAILEKLRCIDSVEIIRIGSRVPCTLPMRVTPELVAMLRHFHPLYINTHFNHPAELTPEAEKACTMLADAGIPMGCQTVLLRGINDDATILRNLFRKLLKIRVRPYYLFQADLSLGTDHFRTTTDQGIAIMRQLYGHLSGMAIPTYALDLPRGKGKVPLTPDYIVKKGDILHFTNFLGEPCCYPEPKNFA